MLDDIIMYQKNPCRIPRYINDENTVHYFLVFCCCFFHKVLDFWWEEFQEDLCQPHKDSFKVVVKGFDYIVHHGTT